MKTKIMVATGIAGVFGFTIAHLALATIAAYRDIQVSSRVGLILEAVSIGIIVIA